MASDQLSELVRPRIQLLSPEQTLAVHHYSIQILEKTGIRVESKTARRIFEKSDGATVRGELVFIQGELINHAIKQAPSCIAVYNQQGKLAFQLGREQGDETWFGLGVTNTFFQDIETGRVEPFTRKHMQHSAKLGDLLDQYDMVSTIGVPSDVPVTRLDEYSALDMFANTAKPLVLLISEDKKIHDVFELLSFLHGDISAKPFCIPYVNPITPLVLNRSTTDKMIASIRNHLPLMYSNYSMYGGTSPMTEGGSLALLNAELLAGLVFSQLVQEGSSVILGSLPAAFNMRSMGSYYTPASYLLNLACAEMMSFYEIPHCGTSGSTIGWGADLLASGDLWQNHLTSCIGKIGCAPFVGGNFDSLAFSPSNVVLSNHIIKEARKFARGFNLNPETVNLAEIERVGQGGNYFTSEQTLAALSESGKEEVIWPALTLQSWEKEGRPRAEKYLIEFTKELYAKAITASEEGIDLIKKGEEFINRKSS